MLTSDELRKKRWKKELRRKEKKARIKRGFQKGHKGYWKGKKRSEADKKAMQEGKARSDYQFTNIHKENLIKAHRSWWSKVKGLIKKVK